MLQAIQKYGWRELYQHEVDETKKKEKEKELLLPIVHENDEVIAKKTTKRQTKAPALHTEASILASMKLQENILTTKN